MPVPPDAHEDLNWRKARRSINHGACVEVASAMLTVAVRDSMEIRGPVLRYPAVAWRSFLVAASAGRYDADLS